MKRYIGLLLTIVCVIALNGCGKNNAAETETNSGMESTVEDIGYIDESGNCVIMADTDGEIASMTNIDWASVPHYYLYDNMIVQYVGLDEEILALLSEFCGEQFAGGNHYLSKL